MRQQLAQSEMFTQAHTVLGAITLNMRRGVISRPRAAGSRAPLNQVTQGLGMLTPSSDASFMHSRFCAAAVRNSAEECTEPWNCACTRNLPSFPALGFPAGTHRVEHSHVQHSGTLSPRISLECPRWACPQALGHLMHWSQSPIGVARNFTDPLLACWC
jgi:hypothetical protein